MGLNIWQPNVLSNYGGRVKRYFFLVLILFLTLEVCDGLAQSTYLNPVFRNYKSHDLSLIRGKDGYIYAFGTCNVPRNDSEDLVYYGVNIFRSKNLTDWRFYKRSHGANYLKQAELDEIKKYHAAAFSQGQYFLKYGDSIVSYPMWAPDVIEYNGRYLMFVSLRNSFEDSKIAVFEAKKLSEDFVFKRIVVSHDPRDKDAYVPSKEIIDPFPIIDNGNLYLVYGSFARDGNGKLIGTRKGIGVYIVKLDKKNYRKTGKPVYLTDYYEGCSIQKHAGKYYLFGTNGNWKNHTYKISYAVGNTLTGPYFNQEGKSIADTVNVNLGEIILQTTDASLRYNGFGCMSNPITDKDGRYFVLANGHDLSLSPIVGKSSKRERYGFLLELHWDERNNPYFNIKQIEGNGICNPKL